jgi:hypothetical protein
MTKHIVKGWITYRPAEFDFEKPKVGFVDFKPTGSAGWGLLAREHSIEVELPDDFDPRAAQIDALKAEQTRIRGEMSARISQLQEQINKLTAIEFAGSGE